MDFTIFPYTKIITEKKYSDIIVNSLSLSVIRYKANIKGNTIEITVAHKYAEDTIKIFNEKNAEILSVIEYGLLSKLKNFRRIGLVFGAIALLLTVFISSRLVWQIDVCGNENISDEEVIAMLENSGLYLGKFIPSINYDRLHNNILLNNEEISWVSVNIDGTKASVMVKESKKTEEQNEYYSNIVAKCDAQILEIRVKNGEGVIKINDVVREGDLLISGIIDSQALGVRYEKAEGEVIARTLKQILVNFSYLGKEKVYTGRVVEEKKIKIFSKVINFSIKDNKNIEFCDKIEKSEQISLFDKYKLPIFVENTRYIEYEYRDKEYSKQEAIDLCFKELRDELDLATENATLVSKTIETSYDENGFYIACNLECIENIAKEVRIYKE